jgi:hypothetical protein
VINIGTAKLRVSGVEIALTIYVFVVSTCEMAIPKYAVFTMKIEEPPRERVDLRPVGKVELGWVTPRLRK